MIMQISPVSRYGEWIRGNGRIRLFISRLWGLFSLRNEHFFGKIISVISLWNGEGGRNQIDNGKYQIHRN